jgi:hypothetical protein
MFHSASLKLGLERAVLSQNREQQADESDDGKSSKNKTDRDAQAKEIDELLKKGAYDIFREEDDKEAEKFMETDIDQLLEKSSKKVTYGASATSALGSGLGSFSKASFVANTDEGDKDVDLDDPEFWQKSVGLEAPLEAPEEVAQMLDDGVKRSRKQVEVYDPYADQVEAEKLKKERLLLEKMLEKEEKERLRMEKKMKKKEARLKKEKEKREREQQKLQQQTEKMQQKAAVAAAKAEAKKLAREEKLKKPPKEPKLPKPPKLLKESKLPKEPKPPKPPKPPKSPKPPKPPKAPKQPKESKAPKPPKEPKPPKSPKPLKAIKPKKSKKNDRQRALRRAENEDPPLERLKQVRARTFLRQIPLLACPHPFELVGSNYCFFL